MAIGKTRFLNLLPTRPRTTPNSVTASQNLARENLDPGPRTRTITALSLAELPYEYPRIPLASFSIAKL